MIEKKLAINAGMPQRFEEIRGDMSIVEFCRTLGISVTKWWLFEMGRGLPSFEELMGICLITKTSPSWIMFGTREEFPFAWRKSRRRQVARRPNDVVQISLVAHKRIALENICKFLVARFNISPVPLFLSGRDFARRVLKRKPLAKSNKGVEILAET